MQTQTDYWSPAKAFHIRTNCTTNRRHNNQVPTVQYTAGHVGRSAHWWTKNQALPGLQPPQPCSFWSSASTTSSPAHTCTYIHTCRTHLWQRGAIDSPPGNQEFHRTKLALVRRHENESVLARVIAMMPRLDWTEKMDYFDILTKPAKITK